MKKNTKRNLAILLSTILLSSAMIACGETGSPADTDEKPGSETPKETETEEPSRTPVGLPDNLDFGGAEFHTIALEWQGFRYYFFADEDSADVMDAAIYKRTVTVEEALHVDLTHEYKTSSSTLEVPDAVIQSIMSGEDLYQHALIHCCGGVAALSSGGYLYNLDTLPNIDTKAEWWNQEQMDVLRLGSNTYYAVNDYLLPTPYIIYFNKQMINDLDMENPYQLVYDGKWTLDKFIEMCESVVMDVNNDGKMTREDDRFALTCNEGSKYGSFGPGCEQFGTEKDPETGLRLIMNTDKMVDICTKFVNLSKMGGIWISTNEYDPNVQVSLDTNRLLFQMGDLSQCEQFRDYTVEFGFLPYPKYNEEQKTYRSLDWGGFLCIPNTIRNPEMVGAVTELLAYVSGDTVIPTYYNTVLTGKLTRDEDARKMLDIIFDTICYDVGNNYFSYDATNGGWVAPFNQLFHCVYNLAIVDKSTDFASFYNQREASAMTSISNYFEALKASEAIMDEQ